MNFRSLVLWCLISVFLQSTLTIDEASFYGGSYISIPLKEAKSSTDIHFKFRTHLTNALIFLVAGVTDYCIVRLDNGRLKLNINLGAGESELLSSSKVKLNDFKWHEVFIVRKEANLSILIDSVHTVDERLPGKFFELNVHYGLFVGGRGNFSELFFGHADKFRGCLAEVMYNGILVLDQARHRQLQAVVHGVTWNCAAEFSADVNEPVSFVEDGSFMSLPHPPFHNQLKLQLELKTLLVNCTLVYNSGPVSKPDFLAVEIINGNLRTSLRHAEKFVEVTNGLFVSDGFWHKMSLRVSSTSVDLNVDNVAKSIKKPRTHSVELGENFHVGGMEASKRTRAIIKGLKTADVSFQGCLRHLVIGDKQRGLPDAHITDSLLPGCVFHYPCLHNPCTDSSVCTQQGLDSFRCECNEELCVNPNYTHGYKVFSHSKLELIALEPLEVLEGGSVIITTSNLHVILDYPKYGIRASAINFKISEAPMFGSISIDIWPHEKNSFTLEDVARDKVHYIHDGSENHLDHVVLEVEFSASESYTLPAYLQGKFRFTLAATVTAVNDPPVLDVPSTVVFRLAQGTRLTLNDGLLSAKDPDSSPDHLVYKINQADAGHFEYVHKPDVPVTSFTQQDVENERVAFVHHKSAPKESHISLQVSDGIETSAPAEVRVSAFPQFWRLQNNTGLVLKHFSAAVITPFNLSFVSNVQSASDDAQFQVVQSPQFGAVEVERELGVWINAVVFTSSEIKQHRVRYRHVNGQPDFDEFQFRSSLNASVVYTFRMTFARCSLINGRSTVLELHAGSLEAAVTNRNLQFQTEPLPSDTTSISFIIACVPKYGYLFSAVSKYRLKVRDGFTQEDVSSGNIRYSLYRKTYSFIRDIVSFNIGAPGCANTTGNLTVVYYPPETSDVYVSLQPLQVEEGGNVTVTHSHLRIQTKSPPAEIFFNVTERPQHGLVQVNGNTSDFFMSNELSSGHIRYFHDGSETRNDSFTFLALSDGFEYVGKLDVDVLLKNDNGPVRVVDRVFHVVVGGTRLLTGDDLKYVDVDLDTKTSDIVYTCRELSNGEIYSAKNLSAKLTQFTQQDLDDKVILFKHSGLEYGKVKLWVTDGQFYVNGILEVQASAPFIRIFNNRKLIVQHGKSSLVTDEHLFFSTNLYASEQDVVYEVTRKPAFGKIMHARNKNILSEFTQQDVSSSLVEYVHQQNAADADEVSFRVRCRDALTVAQLGVWILPASFWEPLTVKNRKLLAVEESTSVLITKNTLQVFQTDVPASAIVYHVRSGPDYGYLSVLSPSQTTDQSLNVLSFTQALVNEERVVYIQSGANQTNDRVVFNLTNGVVWLHGLELEIQIIPEHLYVASNTLRVNEGGTAVVSATHLVVLTDYYKNRVTDYNVVKQPEHGCLQINRKCVNSRRVSQSELLANAVQYAHDGSENLRDAVGFVAIAGDKRSLPVDLLVQVLPINDQKPVLVNNTGLVMWEGGTAVITNSMLAVVDADRPRDVLRYQVLRCWWGNVSLLSDASASLQFFTQELIDKNLVAFRHQSGPEAKFSFNVSDGLHSTKEHTFYVKAKPVTLKLTSKVLHIFPLQKKFLTHAHLLTTISDPERTVTYTVVKPPTLGRLMMESDVSRIFKVVSSFTQFDLNNSRVFYEHTHPFAGLDVNDSFVFNAEAHLTKPFTNRVFRIDISVISGGLDAYVNVPKISVDEGGMTNVALNLSGVVTFLETHAGLRAPIIHAFVSPPKHGQVFSQQFSNLSTFTQQQLEFGQVHYQHDHSDTLGDNIYFSLYLIPGFIPLCNVTVPVKINPINDQAFKLITRAPHVTVVQGENHTITREELLTEDADTPASELEYVVFTEPAEGTLVLLPDRVAVTQFTQADVDANKLTYVHNSSVLTDQFHLRVFDGKFRPEYTVFNIRVIPVYINVTVGLPLYLQQGSSSVAVTERQFFIDTNADKRKVRYAVQKKPKYGVLFVRDSAVFEFQQPDLDNENVRYMQTDMRAANDSFRVFVGITSGNTSMGNQVEVVIRVQPLMQIGNFSALVGKSNKITLEILDATSLAKQTNSNPRYTIVSRPKYGQFRRIIRSSGEQRNILNAPVVTFTHEEIQGGLIFLVIGDVQIPYEGYNDFVLFELAASTFQPAIGSLRVVLRTSLDAEIQTTLAAPSDPAGHIENSNVTNDYFLIVSIIAGVVVLGIIIIVIVKCRSLEPDELKKEEQMPIPLPRPPDRLLVSASPLKQPLQDGYVSPLPAALPHCKVTPLNRGEMDTQTRYPYGVDEHPDDWSSCDASDLTCPNRNNVMLRRNQYWV